MNYKAEQLFYYDIETAGNYKDLNVCKEKNPREYELFLKKYEKKKEDPHWKGTPEEAYLNNAGLMPEYGRVVCVTIGFFKQEDGEHEPTYKMVSLTSDNEKELILKCKKYFDRIQDNRAKLCGFNIKRFDGPFLVKKFLKYGIKVPENLSTYNKKPWEIDVEDLLDIWSSNSFKDFTSFDEMCKDLDVESPKSDISGDKVHHVYWNVEHGINRIVKYCENDVRALKDCALKLFNCL